MTRRQASDHDNQPAHDQTGTISPQVAAVQPDLPSQVTNHRINRQLGKWPGQIRRAMARSAQAAPPRRPAADPSRRRACTRPIWHPTHASLDHDTALGPDTSFDPTDPAPGFDRPGTKAASGKPWSRKAMKLNRRNEHRMRCPRRRIDWQSESFGPPQPGWLNDVSPTGLSFHVVPSMTPSLGDTLTLTRRIDGQSMIAQVVRIRHLSPQETLVGCMITPAVPALPASDNAFGPMASDNAFGPMTASCSDCPKQLCQAA